MRKTIGLVLNVEVVIVVMVIVVIIVVVVVWRCVAQAWRKGGAKVAQI